MSVIIFVTGLPGSGKSQLVQDVLRELGIRAGGISTPEIREGGTRTGFKIIDLLSGREGILASIEIKTKPRVSKYGVNLKDLKEVGIKAIENALKNPDVKLLVIDELGAMEMCAPEFEQAVERVLASNKNILVVLHRKFISKYKNRGKLFMLTRGNFDQVKRDMLALLG